MHSVEADSIWLRSFIWTWQEAAAAESHQREALWGEDQIRASDARMDPAKRRPWIHTHTQTHKLIHAQATTLQRHSIYFHIFRSRSLDGYTHSYAEAYVHAHSTAPKHTTHHEIFVCYFFYLTIKAAVSNLLIQISTARKKQLPNCCLL